MACPVGALFSGMLGMILIYNYSVFQERLIEDMLECLCTDW